MTNDTGEDNTYVLKTESVAEMTRLINQNALMTRAMGGILPEQADEEIADINEILDVACGPGEWIQQVALTYPDKQVFGVDISRVMIEYARAFAKVRHISNVEFQIMDITQPLNFPDASFDLLNARLLFGVLRAEMWPKFLSECYRLVRPGGVIRLTEGEEVISNKASVEKFFTLITHALQKGGYGFSPTGQHFGVTHMLRPLLIQAGFQHIQGRPFYTDLSYGMEAHAGYVDNFKVLFDLMKPFLQRTGVITSQELDALYEEFLIDAYQDDYNTLGFGLTVWGVKP